MFLICKFALCDTRRKSRSTTQEAKRKQIDYDKRNSSLASIQGYFQHGVTPDVISNQVPKTWGHRALPLIPPAINHAHIYITQRTNSLFILRKTLAMGVVVKITFLQGLEAGKLKYSFGLIAIPLFFFHPSFSSTVNFLSSFLTF